MAKRRALGSDPFEALTGASGGEKRPAAKAKAPKIRAQLNVLFDSWVWVDWVRGAKVALTPYQGRSLNERDVVALALEAYRNTLTPKQRREVEIQALAATKRREKGDKA